MSQTTESLPLPPTKRRLRVAHVLYAVLLLLGLLLTLFFALRAVRSYRHFVDGRDRPPREAIGDIAPWMSVPYVAAAYGVPADFLFEQLKIPAEGNDRKPLRILEREYFNGERGAILESARAAVELYYAGGPVPTPIIPNPEDIPPPEDMPQPRPPRDTTVSPRPDSPPPSQPGDKP